MSSQLNSRGTTTWEPQKNHWWYEAIIDWMIANPQGTLMECAAALQVHKQTITLIQASDVFQERYAEARQRLREKTHERIMERLGTIATKGLEIIEKRLDGEKVVPKSSLQTISDVTQKSLSALGYGQQKGGGVTIINQNQQVEVGASKQAVEEARKQIRRQQDGRRRLEIDVDVLDVQEVEGEKGQLDLFGQMVTEREETEGVTFAGRRIPRPEPVLESDPLANLYSDLEELQNDNE